MTSAKAGASQPSLGTLPKEKEKIPMTTPNVTVEDLNQLTERVRSEFLANVNHDLRTPLNAVIGFAQIIESEIFGKIENPQYLEYIRHIQESGFELLSKIEDLCGGCAPDAVDRRIAELPRKKQLAAVD